MLPLCVKFDVSSLCSLHLPTFNNLIQLHGRSATLIWTISFLRKDKCYLLRGWNGGILSGVTSFYYFKCVMNLFSFIPVDKKKKTTITWSSVSTQRVVDADIWHHKETWILPIRQARQKTKQIGRHQHWGWKQTACVERGSLEQSNTPSLFFLNRYLETSPDLVPDRFSLVVA